MSKIFIFLVCILQAKTEINDCETALQDFERLCSLKPDNKAAQNYIIICQNKIKKQKLKDKSTYNKMFEIFVKQDEVITLLSFIYSIFAQ